MTKQFLNDNNVDFEYVDVDLLTGEKRTEVLREVFRLTGAYSFPVVVVADTVTATKYRSCLQERYNERAKHYEVYAARWSYLLRLTE
jgi:glutaredoxin